MELILPNYPMFSFFISMIENILIVDICNYCLKSGCENL